MWDATLRATRTGTITSFLVVKGERFGLMRLKKEGRIVPSDPISRTVKSERLMVRKGTNATWDFNERTMERDDRKVSIGIAMVQQHKLDYLCRSLQTIQM